LEGEIEATIEVKAHDKTLAYGGNVGLDFQIIACVVSVNIKTIFI
jgi:hypothetical protein